MDELEELRKEVKKMETTHNGNVESLKGPWLRRRRKQTGWPKIMSLCPMTWFSLGCVRRNSRRPSDCGRIPLVPNKPRGEAIKREGQSGLRT